MDRYLVDFDTRDLETEYHDVLIIGSGIAGVYTALEIPQDYDVAILTKESLEDSNSVLAQGGIAVSLDKEDSPELHFRDTIYAGGGLSDEESVWVLVNEAAENINKLCKFGVEFDRKNAKELSLTREGAHSKNRIIHSGDTTGKEVCDKLISIVKGRRNVKIKERTVAIDLITEDNTCKGIIAFDEYSSKIKLYVSNFVICATGGFGQIYSHTTNPEVATGDGISLAYRAGAELMDLEFVQFHPTVLYHPENKSFLISEAVRGEGALLKNINGQRFMPQYHQLNELAPRDIVSRAIFEEMRKTGSPYVYLDITFKGKIYLENRFPNIYKTCLGYGIDLSKDYIPVAPTEHYCMGGIKTDVFGKTNLKGFYACGEAACNGIHGSNRLASNSLLEGLVFGRKISIEASEKITAGAVKEEKININFKANKKIKDIDKESIKKNVQRIMTENVGIIRDRIGLMSARESIEEISEVIKDIKVENTKDLELQNIVILSKLVIDSALEREESRGAHFRSDFPEKNDVIWRKNIVRGRGRF